MITELEATCHLPVCTPWLFVSEEAICKIAKEVVMQQKEKVMAKAASDEIAPD